MENEMHSQKLESSEDVLRIVRDIAKMIFNVHSEKQMVSIFGVSHEQLKMIIQKIIYALPNIFFLPSNRKKLEEIKTILAREFIFFQLQEQYGTEQYDTNLNHFISLFCKDIQKPF